MYQNQVVSPFFVRLPNQEIVVFFWYGTTQSDASTEISCADPDYGTKI